MALTAMRLEAVEAQELGIVHVVCQPEELDRGVDAAVVELLGGGPQAQREVKALFARLAPGPVDAEVRELTARTISRVRGSDEAREGFAAFLGKRPARWTAR
jgi:methylglutaconyl-CoA hydratase